MLGRRFRQSHSGIGAVDLIVAATALELQAPLATHNVRRFPMFKGLQPPY
jgi:predicted nucleic acid-binding protein